MTEPKIAPLTLMPAGAATKSDPWTRIQLSGLPRFDAHSVLAQWPRLQAGQGDFAPPTGELVEGWVRFHNGDFEGAATIGLQAGGSAGLALANRATAIYANYVEPREAVRLALFRHVAERAGARAHEAPDDCQAHYWHAYALGRYSQGVSVARALAQGFGGKVKDALERVIELQPRHADAHLALGAFHAEVIDKVGALVGRMTYGVRPDAAIALFNRAIELNPDSPSGLMEYAHALQMLYGESRHAEATRLFERAAAHAPADARERLDVELAKSSLAD
jgi:tetratricopeptide (TPR) repeat protein